ncbi:MAG: Rpn family recombination-promoting nuclease/putative transposase [Magnetococcales bacterium]|nr:Rpn family recombination-promoting nuclease/putative transposase [Magnetococcales bacterium]
MLIENKISPDPRIGWQLLKYMVEALKQWNLENEGLELLPAIVPFTFYQGEAEWKIPEEFLALVDMEDS